MAGYGRRVGHSTGVHDDLAAQALVVSDGKRKAAMVSVDVLALGIRICDSIAARIASQTDIPAEAVMVCATHTHSGPQFNIFATPGNGPSEASDRDLDWERALPEKIARAVIEADANLRPAIFAAGRGRFDLATNRRLMRTDGTIQLAPNYTAATETELMAVGFYEATGEENPIAVLVNYPCHGVVLCEDNLLYSRDWPGFAVDTIEALLKDDELDIPVIALFTQGASGNLDPARRGNFDTAAVTGGTAGMTALRALEEEAAAEEFPFLCRRIPLRLGLRDLSGPLTIARANVRQTEVALQNHGDTGGYHLKRLTDQHQRSIDELNALLRLEEANRKDRRVDQQTRELKTHMTILAIGEVAFVGIPGELFVELGIAIRSNSYFKHTLVLGYCNDLAGYFPTRDAYELGGYEVETSRVTQGSGEFIAQQALANMAAMRREITTKLK